MNVNGLHCSVFFNNALYHYFESGTFTKISNLDSDITRTLDVLATLDDHGYNPSLTGYKRSHLFLTGGTSDTSFSIVTVSVYSVDRDEWSPCPNLN